MWLFLSELEVDFVKSKKRFLNDIDKLKVEGRGFKIACTVYSVITFTGLILWLFIWIGAVDNFPYWDCVFIVSVAMLFLYFSVRRIEQNKRDIQEIKSKAFPEVGHIIVALLNGSVVCFTGDDIGIADGVIVMYDNKFYVVTVYGNVLYVLDMHETDMLIRDWLHLRVNFYRNGDVFLIDSDKFVKFVHNYSKINKFFKLDIV
jgi:membrane protein implicated in regulation of membrane protease activity